MRRDCPNSVAWASAVVAAVLLTACCTGAVLADATNNEYNLPYGICTGMDLRMKSDQLSRLRGCRVIEGSLSIVVMEQATVKSFENVSFPELREINGYIKIYRMKGVTNLGDVFPNLEVVWGMQLFKEYAIVIFDNEDLQAIGLRSLSMVHRGAVRIQHNDRLCYTNNVDWSRIMTESVESNVIRENYDQRLCRGCNRAPEPQCATNSEGHQHCWDAANCQKVCPSKCDEISYPYKAACMSDGTCCHKSCLGGCDGPGPDECHVCRNLSTGYGRDRKCVERCPDRTYQLFRRCVLEEECRNMTPPVFGDNIESGAAPNIPAYKVFNNTCIYICPIGYMEVGHEKNSTCVPCPDNGCTRECNEGIVDSIFSAEKFKGCTHVKGSLTIALRASGGNSMATLEDALGEIRVIEGVLKVTRSKPLVSLMFLKNLRTIKGISKESNVQSLHIFNNPNLELLWDFPTHGPLDIQQGRLYIQFNPKLCYNKITPLKDMIADKTFTDSEVSEVTNGDQAACTQKNLKLAVQEIGREEAVLRWELYCPEDIRKLLGYSIYYIVAEHNVTMYGQRDACSDAWNVIDMTLNDLARDSIITNSSQFVEQSIIKNDSQLELIQNPCNGLQPGFRMITKLTAYTRYAVYVKSYTTLQDRKGAVSDIIYFRTLPGSPSPPQSVIVEAASPHAVSVKWSPPALANGTIMRYHVEIQANVYNKRIILSRKVNYCINPSALSMLPVRGEEVKEKQEDKVTGDVKNGTCSCRPKDELHLETRPKFNARIEAERIDNIKFENDLQNDVYKKKPPTTRTKIKTGLRTRRSIDINLNNMMVILSKSSTPKPGSNYTNTTDEKVKCSRIESNVCVIKDEATGYVQSLFYELDGNTRLLVANHLRHFTWYTVNIWACRHKHEQESQEDYVEYWCSERTYYTFQTPELPGADLVTKVRAEVITSNKTLPEVNISWQPPSNPNGFVVAYNIHLSRIEDNAQAQEVGLPSCISAEDFEGKGQGRGYVVRNLASGNYSVRVTPITLSGPGNLSSNIYVLIPDRPLEQSYGWVYGVVGGCILVIIVVGAGIWFARRELPTESNKLIATVNPEYVSTMYVPDEWEVPRENIKLLKELGQGSFGMVYEGLAKNIEKGKTETRCAVKTVNEHATDRERIEFLNEASVMKAFDTHHVVRLLGVVSRAQPTLVVMELMECGDLKTYLRSHRPESESSIPKRNGAGNPPTLQNILQMAIEIADGMAYLSAKKFVHRDLAARNCMVAGDLTVKVGDFGMTRDIYETDYYRKGTKGLLPVRWMSPESLKDGVFSSNSDVWSYGVVIWEMATLAMQPYQGLSNEQVVRYVGEGGVMERPEHCPDRLYELMRACWAHRPSARPSFLHLVADLAHNASPHFRQRSFFHSPQGQEFYSLQRTAHEDEQEIPEVNVGAVATGSASNLFGVSGRLASWVRELSSLRSRASDDAAAEPLQPAASASAHCAIPLHTPLTPLTQRGNGVLRDAAAAPPTSTGC